MNQASAESHRVLRLLALLAVSVGVVVLAAAAFVLSYHGIRAIALEAGVSPDLARIYPPMVDVMAGPPPLNDTATRSSPNACLSISPAR